MNIIKCNNGHYYDGDKFDYCPHCAGIGSNDPAGDMTVSIDITPNQEMAKDLDQTEPLTEPKTEAGVMHTIPDDTEKTVGFYSSEVGVEPVVGWLVCVEGNEFGQSFTLRAGKNFIGRNPVVNDIVLQGDASVSREKHAIVIYDPKSRNFLAQPGMSSELFYVNDEVVLQAVKIQSKDFLAVGNTKLMFVPCCGPDFTWDDYRKED